MTSNGQGSSSVKALIVEDTAVETLIFSTMLQIFHCEITVVKNGKEAVDLFLGGKKFDIILLDKDIFLDNDMPAMTSLEAVQKIRAMGETDVKIIGVSVDNNAGEALMSAGVNVFVPKPLKLDVLGAMIQEVINMKNNAIV
uniref:Uncharacterized protein n=2 Tax=Avena sativa TaxID=4498 RepID=A0ACD5Z0I8_AVESA